MAEIDAGPIAGALQGLDRREFLRRTTITGVGLALPGGVLAACGDDSSSSTSVLSVASADWLPADWYIGNSLGPQLVGFAQMGWSLFMGGGGNGKGLELQNALASGYEVSPDQLTHTVTLREGLKFHDGSPIDAAAVVANLRAAFDKNDPLRDRGSYVQVAITLGDPPTVKSVEATDARTVEIVLTEFAADIRVALAFLQILNPKILRNKNYGTDVAALGEAGSGPFRLTDWKRGDFAEYERFDGFFQDVGVERLRLQGIADPGSLALAVRSGDIRVAYGLSKSDFDALIRTRDYRPVASAPAVSVDFLFGLVGAPFTDARVRRAMELAMNREAYTDRFFPATTAIVASQPIVVEGLAGYVPELEPAPYDPDAARALMAEAGVDSAKLSVLEPQANVPISSVKGLLEAVAGDLAEIGITLEINIVDEATFSEQSGTAQAFVIGLGAQDDPFLLFDYYYDGQPKGSLRSSPQISRMLAAARATKSTEERDALLQGIIRKTREQALVIPLSAASYSAVVHSDVKGFQITGTQIDSFHGASIDG